MPSSNSPSSSRDHSNQSPPNISHDHVTSRDNATSRDPTINGVTSESAIDSPTYDYDALMEVRLGATSFGVISVEDTRYQIENSNSSRSRLSSGLSDTNQSFLSNVSSVSSVITTLRGVIEAPRVTPGPRAVTTQPRDQNQEDMYNEENIYEDPEIYARQV